VTKLEVCGKRKRAEKDEKKSIQGKGGQPFTIDIIREHQTVNQRAFSCIFREADVGAGGSVG